VSIQIRKLNKSDLPEFIQLIKVFEDVFEMKGFVMPSHDHLQELLAEEKFMVFVALDENYTVVAGLTAYTLTQYYSTKPLAYIFDLAVATHLQRKGIGKNLITEINKYCKEAGMEEVFVQADKVDGYALDFYRKNNPTDEEDVSHFYFKF
jgi:Acetyltransferases